MFPWDQMRETFPVQEETVAKNIQRAERFLIGATGEMIKSHQDFERQHLV